MATAQHPIIVGMFKDYKEAESAVTDLQQAGFSRDQIEFAEHEKTRHGGILAELKSLFKAERGSDGGYTDDSGHALQNAHERRSTPKQSHDGNVYRDLLGLGIPEQDARIYTREYDAGRSIIAVTDGNRLQEASTILKRHGAYSAQDRAIGEAATDEPGARETPTRREGPGRQQTPTRREALAQADEERTMHLREEQLHVYTRPEQVGEVRLGKRIVTEKETLDMPVTHEEVYIERRASSGQVSTTPIGEGETIHIPISKEQVNVTKQTVDTGEVTIGKRQVQENQTVSDTVRKEEAHLQREGYAPIHETGSDLASQRGTNPMAPGSPNRKKPLDPLENS